MSNTSQDTVEGKMREALNGIGQIAITVSNLDRAVKFYQENLGLNFLFQVPTMAFFDCAGIRLMLSLPERVNAKHGSSIIYFRVADIEATTQAMVATGTRFKAEPHLVAEMEDHDLWMAFFEDSEGNTMALMSEVRRAAGQ